MSAASENSPARPLARKSSYRPRIYKGDYFVIRALKTFIESRMKRWISPGHQVADVGCGEQPLRSQIEGLGGQYSGIDWTQNSQNSVAIIADITQIPLPAASFDIIVCTEVLEHVLDSAKALGELARLLKPQGKIIVTTPFFYPLHEEPHDFLRLTPHAIRVLAQRLDLKIDELICSGNEWEVLATTWDNLWTKLFSNWPPGLRKIAGVLLRVPVNLGALFASFCFKKIMPRKAYLNTFLVLGKSED